MIDQAEDIIRAFSAETRQPLSVLSQEAGFDKSYLNKCFTLHKPHRAVLAMHLRIPDLARLLPEAQRIEDYIREHRHRGGYMPRQSCDFTPRIEALFPSPHPQPAQGWRR